VQGDRLTARPVDSDNVRVLWLNQESLERIESRYPKIASRTFWSLAGTVAERLADVTERL
jgi:hypothetical protein